MVFPFLLGFAHFGIALLRLALGAIFIYHALPKLQKTGDMAKMMGFSTGAVTVLGLVELLAGLSVALGIFLQIGALALVAVMLGALYYKIFVWHAKFSNPAGSSWELDLILLAAAFAILTAGGGTLVLMR